jgi:Ni/Fe-hydrogenase subunit HybB-like protein
MSDRTRFIKDLLWILALAGAVAGAFRLWFGLGATTNLTDAMPWGLWKILNMVGGVALSTSGFTVGFLVYVLRLKRFQPYMKPAILIAFLGYGCSCLALLFDIGLPHRFWHPVFMWNINSFLFEVFWCVMLYFTVTAIELAPTLLEGARAERAVRWLHRIAPGVVIVGISLSSLHHSSLGSLFLVTPQRLHPLWYSPWLPLFFILSAMGAGIMLLVFVRVLCARWYDPEPVFGRPASSCDLPLIQVDGVANVPRPPRPAGPELSSLRALATIGVSLLALYTVLKIADLFVHGAWMSLAEGRWESSLYAFELLAGAVIPLAIVAIPRTRSSPWALGVAGFLAAFGLALNRLDAGILGYIRDAHSVYFPSLIEWVLGLGVIAAAGLLFLLIVERYAIFGGTPQRRVATVHTARYPLDTLRQIWNTVLTDGLHRISLLAVFVIPAAFVLMYPPFQANPTGPDRVRPSAGINAERTSLRIDGDHGGLATIFAHVEHQHRLGDSASCVRCHHVSYPRDRSTPCSRCHRDMARATVIFEHGLHTRAVAARDGLAGWYPANFTCTACHDADAPRNRASAKACQECHKEDMSLVSIADSNLDLYRACSFREAMHKTCIKCHETEAVRVSRDGLADCGTCHETLRSRESVNRHLTRRRNVHSPTDPVSERAIEVKAIGDAEGTEGTHDVVRDRSSAADDV